MIYKKIQTLTNNFSILFPNAFQDPNFCNSISFSMQFYRHCQCFSCLFCSCWYHCCPWCWSTLYFCSSVGTKDARVCHLCKILGHRSFSFFLVFVVGIMRIFSIPSFRQFVMLLPIVFFPGKEKGIWNHEQDRDIYRVIQKKVTLAFSASWRLLWIEIFLQ